MKKALALFAGIAAAVLVVSAASAAPAPAKAAPAKAAPAKTAPAKDAKAAAAPGADCDMHKAEATMMKDLTAAGAKMEMIKLNDGFTGIITTDAKSAPIMEKSSAAMAEGAKAAVDGKAHLCAQCQGMVTAMKAGKVVEGTGHAGNTWVRTVISTDPEMVKAMHADMDAKMAAKK